MITVGIDLAAQPARTGVAHIEWDDDGAHLTSLELGATDERLLADCNAGEKVGIDSPLGWPTPFIDFITDHRDSRLTVPPEEEPDVWRKRLCYRETDLEVKRRQPKLQGLSTSTDRIGVTAMRCAALLEALAADGRRVDRTGSGVVVEVYPAASLAQWRLRSKGYKKPVNRPLLSEMVTELLRQAPWFELGDDEALCRRSDDAFDAVIAALTAAAAWADQAHGLPDHLRDVAKLEGWIALPSQPLSDLRNAVDARRRA